MTQAVPLENLSKDSSQMLYYWEGSTKEDTEVNVNKINSLSNEISQNISAFEQAATKLEKYIENKNQINNLKQQIQDEYANPSKTETHTYTVNGVVHTEYVKVVDTAKVSYLQSLIDKLEQEQEALRTEIVSLLDTISQSNGGSTLSFDLNTLFSDIGSIEEWQKFFKSGRQIGTRNPSDEFVARSGINKEKLLAMIDDVKSKYSGRDAVVMIAYEWMKMCGDAGVRLNYTNSNGAIGLNPYITTSNFLRGSDCCGSVSYLLNAALTDETKNNGFQWRSVGAFAVGDRYSYDELSNMKPGDMFVNGNSHVALVVYVDPENKCFYTLDSADDLVRRPFSSIGGEAGVYDYTKIYEDVTTVDRTNIFNQFKDQAGYNENWRV